MDIPVNSLSHVFTPPAIHPLDQADLTLINTVREELVRRGINPPAWRESDPGQRRRFFDEVRAVLIEQGGDKTNVNRKAGRPYAATVRQC